MTDRDELYSIEKKVRKVAQDISSLGGGGSSMDDLVNKFEGTYTITTTTTSSSGVVSSGATAIVFHLSNTFDGTINGVSHSGAEKMIVKYQAQQGLTLPAISYTINTGTLVIERFTKV
jgi:hypothetical protein